MERMFRLLKASEIDCRVSTVKENGCSLLLYKDARVDQNILDETVGQDRWQRAHEVIDGNLYCNVGIWFDRRGDGYGEWVWKQDVGTESYTEKEKGQASDSFKRACFNWGIGRELYTAPFIWIGADKCNIKQNKDKYTTFDRFEVKSIGYDVEGNINQLVIVNTSRKNAEVYRLGNEPMGEIPVEPERISKKHIDALTKRYPKEEQVKNIFDHFGISKWEEMTMLQLNELIGKKEAS